MTISRAVTKHVRISPRKARLAAGLMRGLLAVEASRQLAYCGQKAGRLLGKTLNSAMANAEMEHGTRREDLKVLEVRVDAGPSWKRAKGKSRGGRVPVWKRTSHFTVVVGTEEGE